MLEVNFLVQRDLLITIVQRPECNIDAATIVPGISRFLCHHFAGRIACLWLIGVEKSTLRHHASGMACPRLRPMPACGTEPVLLILIFLATELCVITSLH